MISFKVDLWAKPGARKSRAKLGVNGEIIMYVLEKPVSGAANHAFQKHLAKLFGVSTSQVKLMGGALSKFKRFEIMIFFTEHKDIDYYIEKLKMMGL